MTKRRGALFPQPVKPVLLGFLPALKQSAKLILGCWGHADNGKILAHVLDAAHAHERRRDPRRRADKLHGALGIGFHSQRARHEWRQAARELPLEHRGAGDERDAQLGCGSDDGHAGAVERLIRAHATYAQILEDRGDLQAANQHLKEVVALNRPDLISQSTYEERRRELG